MVGGERRQVIERRTLDEWKRTETLYGMEDIGCVEENGNSVSSGQCMGRGERRL
jgi:hypothetical protein